MAEKFTYVRSLWGTGGPTVMRVTAGASQSIVKGDLIMVDATNGNAIEAGAAATGIIGIALHGVTTGAGATAPLDVIALDRTSVIKVVNYTGGSVDAATTAMCWGFAAYDTQADGKIDFNDTTGGFLKPVAASVGSTTECVISAAKLWNA